jgi:hypothetical protein
MAIRNFAGRFRRPNFRSLGEMRLKRMSTYTFKVLDGCGDVEDETGVSLRDHDHALR